MNARCCMPPESVRSGDRDPVGQADSRHRVVDELTIGAAQRPEQAAAGEAARRDDLAHRRRRLAAEVRALRHVPDLGAPPATARRVAEQTRRPAVRLLEPEREAEQRRLAAAVRPGDGDELAVLDREVDVLQHEAAGAVAERDVAQLDC